MSSKRRLSTFIKLFFDNPVALFILFSLGSLSLVWFLDRYNGSSFFEGILAEAHGLVLDLIVFGILITIYQNISDKRSKIDRYKEEIDDFRHWKSPESTIRIVGNTKRLIKLGVHEIDFSYCYLEGANFDFYRSLNSVMKTGEDHKGRNAWFGKEIEKSLSGSDFSNSGLMKADLSNTDLSYCLFSGADLSRANLIYCDLRGCNFRGANMDGIAIDGSKVEADWFDRLRSENLNGIDHLENTYIVLQHEGVYGQVLDYCIYRRENVDALVRRRQKERLIELEKRVGKKK